MRLQRHQKLLNRITRNIRRTLDLDIIWQQTVDSLGKKLNLERCIICPYQPSSNKVWVIAEYRRPEQSSILGSEIDISSEPSFAEALATLEPVIMTVSSNQQSSGSKVLVVATCYKDQANSLVALSFVNPCHPLTQAELELAKEVADQLGTVTISQKLIEAMGGEVHFYSLGEGLGSTVTFTVPLYQQPLMVIGH